MTDDPRTLLTNDEQVRFGWVLFAIVRPDTRRFYHAFSDHAMTLLPTVRLEKCMEKLGAALFAQRLLLATLEIYHDGPEWMGVCYGVALESDEACDVIIDYLVRSPTEERTFIAKALNQIEGEMAAQIVSQYTHTPFSLSDQRSTRAFFDPLYRKTLSRMASIKENAARRRLLFE